MHQLDGLVQKIVRLRGKSFLYRRHADGSMVTRFSRLKDPEHGTAVRTYRLNQMEAAHLPMDMWKE